MAYEVDKGGIECVIEKRFRCFVDWQVRLDQKWMELRISSGNYAWKFRKYSYKIRKWIIS